MGGEFLGGDLVTQIKKPPEDLFTDVKGPIGRRGPQKPDQLLEGVFILAGEVMAEITVLLLTAREAPGGCGLLIGQGDDLGWVLFMNGL